MSLTQMHFPRAGGMPISIPPLGPQLLSLTPFQGSCPSAVASSARHAGQQLLAALRQELQGVPSTNVCSHHGPAVEGFLLSLNPLLLRYEQRD